MNVGASRLCALCAGTIAAILLACATSAQQVGTTKPSYSRQPAKPVRVVSIRFGQYSGWCDGYCSEELQVSPGEATLLKSSSREVQRRYPNLKVRSYLSDKHWKELVQLVDRNAVFGLPDHTSCGTCTDGVDEFVEVKFSDHSHKQVTWGLGRGVPKELSDLADKLRALQGKLEKELTNASE